MKTRLAAAVLLAAWLALAAAGCGDDNQAGDATPSQTAAAPTTAAPTVLCDDVEALGAAVDKLANVTVRPGVADELATDLKDVQAKLATVVKSALADWRDEADALRSALTTLESAVKDLAQDPAAGELAAVRTAREQVRTAAANLMAAVSAPCPSVSP
jgi:hypothetical protein